MFFKGHLECILTLFLVTLGGKRVWEVAGLRREGSCSYAALGRT